MNRKTFPSKLAGCALLGLLLIISFQGCSTLENFIATGSLAKNQHSGDSAQQKAYQEFSSGIRAYQESPDSIYKRACYFLERKKYKLALLEFEKIIVIDPSYVLAYNGMGISYDSLGVFTLAVGYYKTALGLNPNLDYVYNNLGYSYLLQNDQDSAIEAFKKAVALKQNDKKYHNNLAIAYARNGFYDQAFKEFTLAADKQTALHNLDILQNENNSRSQTFDHFAMLQTSKQNIEKKSDQKNTASESSKSVPYKLNGGLRVQEKKDFQLVTKNFASTMPPSTITSIDLGIEVSNGNGVNRMARKTAQYLEKNGYIVSRVKNADHFNHVKTIIYYCDGYFREAYRIAQIIPGLNELKNTETPEEPSIKIKVLIGKDLLPFADVLNRKKAKKYS